MKQKGFVRISLGAVLKQYWYLTVLLVIIITVSMSLQLLPALIIRRIVDYNFMSGLAEGIWKLALFYLLASLGSNAADLFKGIISIFLGQKILNRIRLDMSLRLSRLPLKYFINTPVGEIMSRLTTDVDAINTLFSSGIIDLISDLFKIAGFLTGLYIIAPGLIWLTLTALPIMFFLSNFFRKNIYVYEQRVRIYIAAIYTFIQEWLKGVKIVKTYSLEEKGGKKFQGPLNEHFEAVNTINFYSSWFPCVMQTLRALVIALSLWLSAENGTIFSLALSAGTLAAVCDLTSRLLAPIMELAQEFQTIQQAMAGLNRVREFFREVPEERELKEQLPDFNLGINIEALNFSYDEKKQILNNITVRLKPGEKAVFVGRSGAGKTTLMNIIAGLYSPGSGKVSICGVDPFTLPPQKRRRLLGIVPQMPQIFDGTIKENITLGDPSITDEEVMAAAKLAGIHDMIQRLTNAYETVIGEGSIGLSSGEVQLLSLARAVAANPKILLLDEPTSGMDTKTEQEVFAAIRAVGQNRTIFSISHRLGGVVDADTVHLMAQGRIVESGSMEELAGTEGNWYAMYNRMEKAGWRFIKS